MLPGIDGHLLSSAFVEQCLPAMLEPAQIDAIRRELTAWRAACAALGPSSTPRAILQSSAPLFAALGFEPAAQLEAAEPVIAATLRSVAHGVALLVAPWGDPRDPLWRIKDRIISALAATSVAELASDLHPPSATGSLPMAVMRK